MRALVAAAALVVLASPGAAHAARGDLVTVGSGTLGATQRQTSITPSGNTVAFVSGGVATVRDLAAGTTATTGTNVVDVSLSSDGRKLAYSTSGGVFFHDFDSATTTTIQSNASQPALSADGTTVAYVHTALGDVQPQVYARVVGGAPRRVSDNGGPGNGASSRPAVSADGRVIAFSSAANNLSEADGDNTTDAFAREGTGPIEVLSRTNDGAGNGSSLIGGISEDGARVVFHTTATNLGDGDVLVFERPTAKLLSAAPDGATQPAISPDGRFVAYVSGGVALRDLNSTTVVPASAGGQRPSVSRAGRFVVFDDGGTVARRETREPPAIITRPSISGTAQDGQTLQCSQGAWTAAPTSYEYAWLVDGLTVAGANGPSYLVQSADVGRDVRCRVTATNQDDSTSEISDGVRPAARPEDPFVPPLAPPDTTPVVIAEPPMHEVALRVSPRRDRRAPHRFTLRGTVTPALGCRQPVGITVMKGAKRVARRTVTPDAACELRTAFTFTRRQLGRRGTLRFSVRFPAGITTRTSVRFG